MSKELEALENIFNVIYSKPTTYDEDLSLNVDRKIIEKELKAFNIIKEKRADVFRLAVADNVEKYNKWTEFDEYWLTAEEFNLLKEVLK